MNDIDTSNEHMVGVQDNHIVFLNPPDKITKQRALVLAAWIVSLADDTDVFGLIMEQVQNT